MKRCPLLGFNISGYWIQKLIPPEPSICMDNWATMENRGRNAKGSIYYGEESTLRASNGLYVQKYLKAIVTGRFEPFKSANHGTGNDQTTGGGRHSRKQPEGSVVREAEGSLRT